MERELMRLRREAKKLGMAIRKDRATGGYLLIDLYLNAVVVGPASLETVKERLQWETEQEAAL